MSNLSVYTGVWKNFNHGDGSDDVFNLTLTVSQRDGALLIAFMTLIVTVAMTNLWGILCFAIHQCRSTIVPRPGPYHQQQAWFSNPHSPVSTLVTFVKLTWAWRRVKVTKMHRTSFLLILTSGLYLALFAAAGLFSSRVQLSSNEVLATGNTCGWVGYDITPTEADSDEQEEANVEARVTWARWTALQCLGYVRNCYSSSGLADSSQACQRFTTPKMSLTTTADIACPFDREICAQEKGFQADTGLIDSNRHLGINSGEKDRLWFRKVLTCAPILAEEKHSTDWTKDDFLNVSMPGNSYRYYSLGEWDPDDELGSNITWVASNYSVRNIDGARNVYGLSSIASLENEFPDFFWRPIPELQVDDADVTVLWLFNNARYRSPVEDAWFRATQMTDQTGLNRNPRPDLYMSDQVAASMACTEQYQFCNTTENCSSLGRLYDNRTNPHLGLDLSVGQKATFNLIWSAATSITIQTGITLIGPHILNANDFLWNGDGGFISTTLPPTQWQTETINFVQLMLAALQRITADFASPPKFDVATSDGPVNSYDFVRAPQTDGERLLCSRIRVRDSDYSNFSLAGVIVIMVLGTLITLINLVVLPDAAFWVREKFGFSLYPKREWLGGHLFMQQREALEAKGVGPWQVDKDGFIPWTLSLEHDHDVDDADTGLIRRQKSQSIRTEEVELDQWHVGGPSSRGLS